MQKPILLAMNSPQSTDPSMALYPWDGRAAGSRLLGMLQDAAEHPENDGGFFFPPQEYLRIFERINVLDRKSWDIGLARASAPLIHERVLGRRVIVCGRQVQRVMNYDQMPWLQWNEPGDEVRYCVIPHPSGLSREYNRPEMRMAVGRLLLGVAAQYLSAERAGA